MRATWLCWVVVVGCSSVGGVSVTSSGQEVPDSGVEAVDAGATDAADSAVDATTVDATTVDAGEDAGTNMMDAGCDPTPAPNCMWADTEQHQCNPCTYDDPSQNPSGCQQRCFVGDYGVTDIMNPAMKCQAFTYPEPNSCDHSICFAQVPGTSCGPCWEGGGWVYGCSVQHP